MNILKYYFIIQFGGLLVADLIMMQWIELSEEIFPEKIFSEDIVPRNLAQSIKENQQILLNNNNGNVDYDDDD